MTTLQALYRLARTRLTDAGIESAALDSRLLVSHVTGNSLEDIVCRPAATVSDAHVMAMEQALQRRLNGEPVHRIIGARDFFGLRLGMSSDTLEPRPDTEALVELVLPRVQAMAARAGACRVLDLGTGTGAILLSLLANVEQASGVMTDISAGALATAAENARNLGLDGRAGTVLSDWFDAVEGRFDVIVSNPPYIPSLDIEALQADVRAFDPLRALDGGPDGLGPYRVIAAGAAAHLEKGGFVAVEIGAGQGPDIARIFGEAGFELSETRSDLGGHERALLFVAEDTKK